MNQMSIARCPSALKILNLCLALAFLVLAPAKMRASSFTYDLVLTDSSNSTYSGTGVVTITGPNALQTYTGYKTTTTDAVTALSFTVDGTTFNMTDVGVAQSSIIAEFSALTPTAAIYDITFADTHGTGTNSLTLDTTGSYVFYYWQNGQQQQADGTFSSATLVDPVSAPEPSSILLLGTGFLSAAGAFYRRSRVVLS